MIKDEHIWKLLKWVNGISEQHKKVSIYTHRFFIFSLFQGLRVIKAVIDIKGAKRFKDVASAAGMDTMSI